MKKMMTLVVSLSLMSLASLAGAYGNGGNWQNQRAYFDGTAAAMNAQLHPKKTPEEIKAADEQAGKVIADNPGDYKKSGSH